VCGTSQLNSPSPTNARKPTYKGF